MGMDRNTLIGFILIGALLIAMFGINSKNRLAYEAEQKRIADSISALQPKIDTASSKSNLTKIDSLSSKSNIGTFQTAGEQEQKVVLEN